MRETAGRDEALASGRALVPAMVVLLVCDVIGGFIALDSGADTWNEAWGFETTSTVPLPVGAAQLVMAWLAARSKRPRVGRIAAVLLSAFCLLSVLFGLFDGDLIDNVSADGFFSVGVAWAGVLLVATTVVGLLALARARELYARR
jgi:hypothetical protein